MPLRRIVRTGGEQQMKPPKAKSPHGVAGERRIAVVK
jgi:hypothetical protein